jgi:hypothetical protein
MSNAILHTPILCTITHAELQGFLLGAGAAAITDADRERVAREIKTTFATTYSRTITLEGMLDESAMKEYQAQSSNNKALVVPFGAATAPQAKL